MKTLLYAAAAMAAVSLAACQRTDSQPTAADPGTANTAVNAAQDTVGAAVGQVSANTLGAMTTEGFVTNAAIGNMYEIEAGRIAQQKGRSADVKSFGKMMVTDHTAMTNEMAPLIKAAGQTPPAALDERRKGMIDNLNAAPAADFDRVYLAQQEAAHAETLELMRGYSERGDDAGLKGAAAKAVPKVQAHLDRVRQLQSGAGAGAPPAQK
jgi:putative membrane protein